MASQSNRKAEDKSGSNRAGLPFEPRKKKAGSAKDESEGKGASAKASSGKKAAKQTEQSSAADLSARAQARADEILAGNRRKKKAKAEAKAEAKADRSGAKATANTASKDNSGAIPEAVSRRMLKRMGVLSIAPVALGVGIFFLSYYLQSRELVDLPPIAVLLVTMGCFGLGVLGLTYGVLSASWDTEPGSLVGFSEFKLNFGRVMDARKASKT